jgi:hypothetical protein
MTRDNLPPTWSWTGADWSTVDEEPWAVCEPDRSPAVVVWVAGAIVAALVVVVAWVVWHD